MAGPAQLTYSWIFAVVFARQLCLPLPASLILMGAGAIAATGSLHVILIVIAAIIGCLAADGVWFWMGRRWGSRVVRMVCKLTSDPRGNKRRAHKVFDRWGMKMLSVAKFIPVMDGITPPLAGAEGAKVSQFVLYDGLGALLWSSAYVLLGVLFHAQMGIAMADAQRFGSLVTLFVGLPLLTYICWRTFLLVRVIGYLRSHRLSPAGLQKMMRSGGRVAIIDLLGFEDCEDDRFGIPGAARMDPARMRATPKVALPDDLNVVVYCSSHKQLVSARVVLAMRSKGAKRVWILDGGLKRWRDSGMPVTTELYTAQELAQRLGIELPEPVLRHGHAIPVESVAAAEVLPG